MDRVKPAEYGIECLKSRCVPLDHPLEEFANYLRDPESSVVAADILKGRTDKEE